jgi:hypothetical protein
MKATSNTATRRAASPRDPARHSALRGAVSANRTLLVVACTLYFLTLNWSYAKVDSVLYDGIGFYYADLPIPVFLASLLMAVVPAFWLPIELRYPSQVCYWLMYLCVFMPTMFVPYHVLSYHRVQDVMVLPAAIWFSFALLGITYRFPAIRLPRSHIDQSVVIGIITLAALMLIGFVIRTSGFQFTLSLENVYERRFNARESVVGGSITAYAIATLSHSLGPLLIAIGYVRRNVFTFCVGVAGAICIFALAGTKTDITTPIYLFALLFLVARYRQTFGITIVAATSLLVALAAVQYFVTARSDISVYLVRRQIFLPGLLTSFYWDFFSSGHYVYFSDSFLKSLIPAQYDLPMTRLIGDAYFANAESNANANVWASAFGNLGYAGMFIFTGLLGFLFRLIDGMAMHGDFLVTALMCGMFGLTWTNGGLQTSLLSNGVVVTLIALYFLHSAKGRRVAPSLHGAATSRVPAAFPAIRR